MAAPLVEGPDTNKDGKVSGEEFNSGVKELFAEWETDKSAFNSDRSRSVQASPDWRHPIPDCYFPRSGSSYRSTR